MNTDLTVIIPIFNEEQNIPTLFNRLKDVVSNLGITHEFIFINDGSRDQSLKLIKELSRRLNKAIPFPCVPIQIFPLLSL